ncbi:ASCH domain-containing protein [Ruania halotolerans]|uniref:ASCH domain-containing protein n=1 Tax=Ruania halotolerans TaxID=2897773 RepID=UPI001E493F6A|nr:ASCH domain-containing protein [Ruania halotolerans]UFU07742.1 ASCH domain-containing protein [Ruania halotolerans]
MDSDEVAAFWKQARVRGRVAWLEPFVGQHRVSTLPPPAFAFAPEPHLAQDMAEAVLEGRRTAVSTLRSEFPSEGDLPQEGDLAIVLDGRDHPVALIRTVEVRVCRFAEVDERHAHGEGEESVHEWQRRYRTVLAADEASEVVLERIVLVFPPVQKVTTGVPQHS